MRSIISLRYGFQQQQQQQRQEQQVVCAASLAVAWLPMRRMLITQRSSKIQHSHCSFIDSCGSLPAPLPAQGAHARICPADDPFTLLLLLLPLLLPLLPQLVFAVPLVLMEH
jgi:hypothetical protein